MFVKAEPHKRRYHPPAGIRAYIRFTPRILYLSAGAMELMGDGVTSINISINRERRIMKITPDGDWKLTTVCESRAKRIENGSKMLGILEAGFPQGLIGKYLSVTKDLTGSLIVSLIPGFEMVA